jgi:hypothetical protein
MPMKARSGLAVASCVAALCVSSLAQSEPKWIRLSIVNEPSSTMTVAWHTIDPVTSNAQYGVDATNLDNSAKGKSDLGAGSLGYIHETELTGLKPDTKYYYRVGEDADGWSAVFSFRTAPAPEKDCGKFRFVFLGDNRPDSILGMGDNWSSIFAEAVDQAPGFVLSGGDLVFDGTQNSEWVDFLNWTGEPARYTPFHPTVGNHDDDTVVGDGAQYNQIFALPRSSGTGSSGTEDYYYFTYGNAIVVSLNTQQLKTGATPFADQAAWLDGVLTQNPRRWKFVLLHHPIYTDSTMLSHPPNEQNQNQAFVPIIDKHHVDFVLQSHNHWYERFEPTNCSSQGNPGSANPCPMGANAWDKGTVYVTSGGAGALTIISCGFAYAGRSTCKTDHHYVMFDIDNDALRMQTWASSQQTWSTDPANHALIDEVQVIKSGSVCPSSDGGVAEGGPDGSADVAADGLPQDALNQDVSEASETDSASKPDGFKEASNSKPDVFPSHRDVGTYDEPTPATVGTVSAAPQSGNSGACACRAAPSDSHPWGTLAATLLAGLAWAARDRRSRLRSRCHP